MNTKVDLMNEIEFHEAVYLEIEKWEKGENLSEGAIKVTSEIIGEIESEDDKNKALKLTEKILTALKFKKRNLEDDKLYLSEIIALEKPRFGDNNLILSPVGSGKTHFSDSLIKDGDDILFLVSTTSLKNSLVSPLNKEREKEGDRTYTTKNRRIYGKGTHKKLIMTYAEFGDRIKFDTSFAERFTLIICDEIHSLPLYYSYRDSGSLLVAMLYLFKRHEGQPKYYFTATVEHIDKLKEVSGTLMDNVEIFDFIDHPKIKRYVPLSKYEVTGIEEVRIHLRARRESFEYFGYKAFIFCRTIDSQLRMKKICEEEGFSAEAFWSINNTEKPMSEIQTMEAQNMIETGIIQDKYDVVIINSAMQEGWNLIDERIKLAVMNTTDTTEYTQALGRIRDDIDVLIYRVEKKEILLDISDDYIDKPLTSSDKDDLCMKIGLMNKNGRIYKWRTIRKLLLKQGFIVEDDVIKVDNKRVRVSIINKP